MSGTVNSRVYRAGTLLLKCLVVASLFSLALPQGIQPTTCDLRIEGTATSTTGTLSCSGDKPNITTNYLDVFQTDGGVLGTSPCSLVKCLLTICGSSKVSLTGVTIQGIAEERFADLPILCSSGSSEMTLSGAVVTNNFAGPLVLALDGSSITITNSSSFISNNGSQAAVIASHNASLTISGANFSDNVVSNSSGGAVAARGAAHVTITGGSTFYNNTNSLFEPPIVGQGGAISAENGSQVRVRLPVLGRNTCVLGSS